jgi:predicted ArsR family transcriptional regulator
VDNAQDAGQDERMTVADAAATLGISKEAVRKRITRKTLRSDRDADGTVYVYVPPSGTPSGTASATGAGDRDLLYQEQRERIAYLERQVEEEREARRRADTLLARLMDRVPELEAPSDTDSPSSKAAVRPEQGDDQQGRGDVGPDDTTQRQAPWRRRLFGE